MKERQGVGEEGETKKGDSFYVGLGDCFKHNLYMYCR